MARESLSEGKLNLRPGKERRERCQELADLSGISLNAFILRAIDNYLPYAERGLKYELKEKERRRKEMDQVRALAARVPKVGANQKCPCGSGKKYKACHGEQPVA